MLYWILITVGVLVVAGGYFVGRGRSRTVMFATGIAQFCVGAGLLVAQRGDYVSAIALIVAIVAPMTLMMMVPRSAWWELRREVGLVGLTIVSLWSLHFLSPIVSSNHRLVLSIFVGASAFAFLLSVAVRFARILSAAWSHPRG